MLDQRIVSEQSRYDVRERVTSSFKYRDAAYALLRIMLGVVFLFSGITKFLGGLGGFVSHMQEMFAGKLPSFLVLPFAYSLPFIEVAIGLFIVLGLLNVYALVFSGALLIVLTTGLIITGDIPTVAHNMMYALTVFLLLSFAEHDRYSVDRLVRGNSIRD